MSRLPLPTSHAAAPTLKMRAKGFTLIEVLTTIAIIGILTAIALPSYHEYVVRGALVESFTDLSDLRVQMEQSYLDNRTYVTGCAIPPPTGKYFSFSSSGCSATAYTWTATGLAGRTNGYSYTINQANTKTTTSFKGSAMTGKNCWLAKSASEC